jgi:hypothetical protein
MTSSRRMTRLALAGAAAIAAALPVAQAAQAKPVPPPVPTKVQVPAGNEVFLKRHAIGVQIYTCGSTATGYSWGSSVPRADLYDKHGMLRGTHYAGPTWEDHDGSKVTAARVDGATVDTTAIPWLLLKATPSPSTHGKLGKTTYIQRVATTGGLAPAAADCNAATVGTVAEAPYTADYYFWKAKHA